MSAESPKQFLHSFESDVLPQITWQKMLDNKLVIAPQIVLSALTEAEQLLVTHPGPNLERRKILAPEWFGYWKNLLEAKPHDFGSELVTSGNKLVKFEELSELLRAKYKDERTDMLFVAGAEGHKGHVFAAKYMANVVPVTVWGFEQPGYMQRKTRGAPFLSLPLRLSMWFYEQSLTHLTVLPQNHVGLPDNDHYNKLFVQSDVKYFFVQERDPHLDEKLTRGGQDLNERVISQDFSLLSTTEAVQKLSPDVELEDIYRYFVQRKLLMIPHMPVASTADRVRRSFDDGTSSNENYNVHELLKSSLSIDYLDTLFRA